MLDVIGLTAGYDDLAVVHDVDLTVGEGDVVALLGANGAGKTALLSTICGLNPALRGRVAIDGRDVTGLSAQDIARHGTAYVAAERHLFASMDVLENLRVAAGRQDTAAINEVFGVFPRLGERRRQRAGTLSGGEQQMLAIARALVRRPRLLLLDEPSAGLSPMVTDEVYATLHEVCDGAGTTVVLAEQHPHRALALASRAVVLRSGRVVLDGAAADLEDDPRLRSAYLGGFA